MHHRHNAGCEVHFAGLPAGGSRQHEFTLWEQASDLAIIRDRLAQQNTLNSMNTRQE
jgi:hypothetical protein